MTITVAPRSVQTRAMGQATVLMRRGGGLTAAASALVTPYVAGTDTPYPGALYAGPDATTPLVFPVATGEDGVVELWADAAVRLDVEAVHPTWGANRVTLDLEWPPDATAVAGDAYTREESDARYPLKTDPDPYPVYATDAGLAAVQAELAAVYTEAEADARFEQLSRKGAADGYAPLDAAGLVPTGHLPPLAVNEVFVVASQAAMLALDAQVGDMAVRTDSGLTYVLAADPPGTLANWKEVLAAGQVQSVNGETGVVSLDADDVGAAAVDHTHPSSQSEQWRFQNNPTIADPGDGYLRSNTGVLSTATVLAISRTTQDGYDVPPTGFGVTGGDTVYVQDRDDNSKWVRYTADEPLARFATYATGAVTVLDSAGTIAHGQIVQVTFFLAGGGGGGSGGFLPLGGGTMTGPLVLEGATAAANVLQAKLAADDEPRFRADASGQLEWGPGATAAPDLSLSRSGGILVLGGTGTVGFYPATTDAYLLGTAAARWREATVRDLHLGAYLEQGTNPANTGAVRLPNATAVAWRNAGNTADLALTVDASDQLAFNGTPLAGGAAGSTWASFVIDGGGSVITTGQKGHFAVPAGTIEEVVLLADQSGSIVVDLWKETYASFPPTVGDSICASTKPTLSGAQKSQNTTLASWVTTLADGDLLAVSVDSAATVTRCTVALKITPA